MIKLKYIIVFLVLTSTSCFSQTTFSNLDSLLSKNFQTINARDSIAYLSLINQVKVFEGKKAKSSADSIFILEPFLNSFNNLIDNLVDITSSLDFTVRYEDYQMINKSAKLPENGSIKIHVNMIVNNTFSLKMPMTIIVKNTYYLIETPMTVMFLEGKD